MSLPPLNQQQEQQQRDHTLEPIPVSITLRNLYPLKSTTTTSSNTIHHYHHHHHHDSSENHTLEYNDLYDRSTFRLSKIQNPTNVKSLMLVPVELQIVIPCHILSSITSKIKCNWNTNTTNGSNNIECNTRNGGDGGKEESSILFNQNMHNQSKIQNDGDYNNIVVLLSIKDNQLSSHPVWEHLDEQLERWYEIFKSLTITNTSVLSNNNGVGGPGCNQNLTSMNDELWNEFYKHLKVRIQTCEQKDDHHYNNNGDTTSTTLPVPSKKSTILLAESSLYPKNLRRLPNSNNHDLFSSSTLIQRSKLYTSIPTSLPPNSILIQYSDGLVRVIPPLYHLLIHGNVIVEENDNNVDRMKDDIEENKRKKRFEDDIFDILGKGSNHGDTTNHSSSSNINHSSISNSKEGTSTINACKKITHVTSPSSLIVQQSPYATTEIKPSSNKQLYNQKSLYSSSDHLLALLGNKPPIKVDRQRKDEQSYLNDSCLEKISTKCPTMDEDNNNVDIADRDPFSCKTLELNVIQNEVKRLRIILEQERKMLQQDEADLLHGLQNYHSLVNNIKKINQETKEINLDIEKKRHRVNDLESLVMDHRKRLINELQTIYPIIEFDDGVYTIRGIHLPYDMHSLVSSDDIISSGLGFVCHVVFMLSKYMLLPLRYRIICNSSRSAILDDNHVSFPLFKDKAIEKEQFDRGIFLLEHNINFILSMQGIDISYMMPKLHLLAKVNRIFKTVIPRT